MVLAIEEGSALGMFSTLLFRRNLIDARLTASRVWELERVMGIEPTLEAWEAAVLPLNYTRKLLTETYVRDATAAANYVKVQLLLL